MITRPHAAPSWQKWTGPDTGRPESPTRLRVFCFPYAGGSATVFREWRRLMPRDIDLKPIQLPGRDERWKEPPISAMHELVEQLASDLHPLLNVPFAVFGHSMGAWIAFEFARQLCRWTSERPVHVVVSGARAPHIPDPEPGLSELPDGVLIERLRRLNGWPVDALDNPEFAQLVLPTLRADLRLCDGYLPKPGPKLDSPLSAYAGLEDAKTPQAHVAAWRAQTSGAFRLRFFPGNHFFLVSAREQVVKALLAELQAPLPGLGHA